MAYETFDSKSFNKKSATPLVTIRSNGKITFNGRVTMQFQKEGVDRVVWLWDKGARKMAIAKAKKDDPRSFGVSYHEGGQARTSSKSFFKFIGWGAAVPVKLPLTYSNGMFEAVIPAEFLQKSADKGSIQTKKRKSPS